MLLLFASLLIWVLGLLLVLIGFFGLFFITTGLSTPPLALTVNVTVSVVLIYPFGAIVSLKVYVPADNSLLTICGVLPDTHLSTWLPLESFNTNVAPGNSFPVVASCLLILTCS